MRYKILNPNGLNFLTFTVVDWIDLFTRPTYSEIILESLRFCQQHKGLVVYAYVIMPSHLHLIWSTDDPNGLSQIIQSFKSYTAKQILAALHDKQHVESRREWLLHHFAFHAKKNKTHSNFQVWKKDNHPIALYTPQVTRQKITYIHQNPVRARIVHHPEHYLYSSASNYAEIDSVLEVTLLEDIWNDIGFVGGY